MIILIMIKNSNKSNNNDTNGNNKNKINAIHFIVMMKMMLALITFHDNVWGISKLYCSSINFQKNSENLCYLLLKQM